MLSLQVPTGVQSAFVVHAPRVPARSVRTAVLGHSAEPPPIVVVVPPPMVVVVPPPTVVVVATTIVVVVTGTVVVVPPPPIVVVVTTGIVVDVVDVLDVVVDEVVVVQGQASVTLCPTAFFRQVSASLAVIPARPLTLQIQSGVHVFEPTAVCKIYKQSEAVGPAPVLNGWLQSPCAANAAGVPATTLLSSRAAPKKFKALRMRVVNKAGPPPFVGQSVWISSRGCP